MVVQRSEEYQILQHDSEYLAELLLVKLGEISDDHGEHFGCQSALLDELKVEAAEEMAVLRGSDGCKAPREQDANDFRRSFLADALLDCARIHIHSPFDVLDQDLKEVEGSVLEVLTAAQFKQRRQIGDRWREQAWDELDHPVIVDCLEGLDQTVQEGQREMVHIDLHDAEQQRVMHWVFCVLVESLHHGLADDEY